MLQLMGSGLLIVVMCSGSWVYGQEDTAELRSQALDALKRSAKYFREHVGVEGGYVYRVSLDLSRREGESITTLTQAWIQPPGTPAVGLAFLGAFEATGEEMFREAAIETARALVRGQLRSGGWGELIEFDAVAREKINYRVGPERVKGVNVTTLDDDKTQSAVRFLMRVDRMLEFQDESIHEAAGYALESLLRAQYPNGSWPQRFRAQVDPSEYPALKASFPESWPREYSGKKYDAYYTLNDNSLADMAGTMLDANEIYGDARFLESARRAGQFLIDAQLPEPQPAWAQQYDVKMNPAWARKFEPAAVTGGESQGAIRLLLTLARHTGDAKFLEPVPRAIEWMKRSRLSDGQLARFYEMETNRPLYFTTEYTMTYEYDDLPTHYAFKVRDGSEKLRTEYGKVKAEISRGPVPRSTSSVEREKVGSSMLREVSRAIETLDEQGRWVTQGLLKVSPTGREEPVLESQSFVQNAGNLSRYLGAKR